MKKPLYVDKEMLNDKIEKSGLKINYICEQLDLSRMGFNKKMNGKTPFRIPEVYVLCSLLSLNEEDSAKIFYP